MPELLGPGLKPGVGNSIQISHRGGQDPNAWVITAFVIGNWNWEQNWRRNPDYLQWCLHHRLNTYPRIYFKEAMWDKCSWTPLRRLYVLSFLPTRGKRNLNLGVMVPRMFLLLANVSTTCNKILHVLTILQMIQYWSSQYFEMWTYIRA